jgi:hypothetical protein
MLGLGLTLMQVAVRGGGKVIGPQILISNRTQDENTAIGTAIGTLTVVGGSGTYTFTKTADPSSAFTLTGGTVFTTFNPADITSAALSNVNLTVTATAGSAGARSIASINSGQYYWEYILTTVTTNSLQVGIAPASYVLTSGSGTGAAFVGRPSGGIVINGTFPATLGVALVSGNGVGIAVDVTAKLIWFRQLPSGNWNGSGTANPATGTGGLSISALTGPFYALMIGGSADKVTANFGASAFTGSVPSGFTSGLGTSTPATLKNAIVFDYETTTAYSVTIHADNGAGSTVDRTLIIGVNDIDEVPPVITVSTSQTVPENSAFSLTLTADKPVTWTKTGGADTALFTLAGSTLSMTAKDFEIPTDANTDNAYVVQVTATSVAYVPATTNATITVTVTDVAGPTITSSATFSTPENSIFSTTLSASESSTWAKTGGADTALFTLSGAALSLPAQNFEAPADADANNTYIVQVKATSVATGEVSSGQTITVTVTDVVETTNYLLLIDNASYLVLAATGKLLIVGGALLGADLVDGSGNTLVDGSGNTLTAS